MIQKTPGRKLLSLLIQLLIWLVFGMALLVYQPLTLGITLPAPFWIKQAIVLFLLVSAYYFNARLLVPKYLLKNQVRNFILLLILLIVAIVLLSSLADKALHIRELMENAISRKDHQPPKGKHYGFEMFMIIITGLVLGISTSVTATQKWQNDLQLRQTLEQDKISSELSFLKAQINPHFFFNTLNNIYALTLINVEDSRKALHELSRMMRYLLYETQQGSTLLSKEIAFIRDFVSLMQLRLNNLTALTIQIPTELKDTTIAPMLFLPFIENAFKHGISSTKPGKISISIIQHENLLELLVCNSVFKEQQVLVDENKGIGLNNTIRRLDLLYSGKYKLDIDEKTNPEEFSVHLKIDLK